MEACASSNVASVWPNANGSSRASCSEDNRTGQLGSERDGGEDISNLLKDVINFLGIGIFQIDLIMTASTPPREIRPPCVCPGSSIRTGLSELSEQLVLSDRLWIGESSEPSGNAIWRIPEEPRSFHTGAHEIDIHDSMGMDIDESRRYDPALHQSIVEHDIRRGDQSLGSG